MFRIISGYFKNKPMMQEFKADIDCFHFFKTNGFYLDRNNFSTKINQPCPLNCVFENACSYYENEVRMKLLSRNH